MICDSFRDHENMLPNKAVFTRISDILNPKMFKHASYNENKFEQKIEELCSLFGIENLKENVKQGHRELFEMLKDSDCNFDLLITGLMQRNDGAHLV